MDEFHTETYSYQVSGLEYLLGSHYNKSPRDTDVIDLCSQALFNLTPMSAKGCNLAI